MKYLMDLEGKGRVPTFFTYVFGKVDGQGELPLTCQGPHTVAHRYILEYVDRKYWKDLFKEQILPYSPEEIEKILVDEECRDFKNLQLYLYDYKQLYSQLYTWNECGILSDIDAEIIQSDARIYHVVRNSIICIMEMHPYGSYGWNRENPKHIMKCEIAGKSERIIELDQKDEQAEIIIDTHASFKMSEAYKNFLCTRLERYDAMARNDLFNNWDTVVEETICREYVNLVQDLRDKVEEACKGPKKGDICCVMSVPLLQAYHYLVDAGKYNLQLREVRRALWEFILLEQYHGLPEKSKEIWVLEAGREMSGKENPDKVRVEICENCCLAHLVGDIVGEFSGFETVVEEQGQEEQEQEQEEQEQERLVLDGGLSLIEALDLYVFSYTGKTVYSRAGLMQIRKEFIDEHGDHREELLEWMCEKWDLEKKVFLIEVSAGVIITPKDELLSIEQEIKPIYIFYDKEEDIYSAGREEISKMFLQEELPENNIILSLISTLAGAVGRPALHDEEKSVIKDRIESKVQKEQYGIAAMEADLNTYVAYARRELEIPYTVQVWVAQNFWFDISGEERVIMIQYENNMFHLKNHYSSKNRNSLVYQFEQQCMEKGFGIIGASYSPIYRIRRRSGLLPGEAMCPSPSVISNIRREFNIYAGISVSGKDGFELNLPGEDGLEMLELNLPWCEINKFADMPFEELVLPFPDKLLLSIQKTAELDFLCEETIEGIYSDLGIVPQKWLKDNMHVISVIRKYTEIPNTLIIFSAHSPIRVYTGNLAEPALVLFENDGVYEKGMVLNIEPDIAATCTVSAGDMAIADMDAEILKSLKKWEVGIGYYSLTTLTYAILKAAGREIDNKQACQAILNLGAEMCREFAALELFISFNEENVAYIKKVFEIENAIILVGKDYDGQEKEGIPGKESLKKLYIKYEDRHYEAMEE